MSKKRPDWLASRLGEKSKLGKLTVKAMQQGLGRLGYAPVSERPFLEHRERTTYSLFPPCYTSS